MDGRSWWAAIMEVQIYAEVPNKDSVLKSRACCAKIFASKMKTIDSAC